MIPGNYSVSVNLISYDNKTKLTKVRKMRPKGPDDDLNMTVWSTDITPAEALGAIFGRYTNIQCPHPSLFSYEEIDPSVGYNGYRCVWKQNDAEGQLLRGINVVMVLDQTTDKTIIDGKSNPTENRTGFLK